MTIRQATTQALIEIDTLNHPQKPQAIQEVLLKADAESQGCAQAVDVDNIPKHQEREAIEGLKAFFIAELRRLKSLN